MGYEPSLVSTGIKPGKRRRGITSLRTAQDSAASGNRGGPLNSRQRIAGET